MKMREKIVLHTGRKSKREGEWWASEMGICLEITVLWFADCAAPARAKITGNGKGGA